MEKNSIFILKKTFASIALILLVFAVVSTFGNLAYHFLPRLTLPLWIAMLACFAVAKIAERYEQRKALLEELQRKQGHS